MLTSARPSLQLPCGPSSLQSGGVSRDGPTALIQQAMDCRPFKYSRTPVSGSPGSAVDNQPAQRPAEPLGPSGDPGKQAQPVRGPPPGVLLLLHLLGHRAPHLVDHLRRVTTNFASGLCTRSAHYSVLEQFQAVSRISDDLPDMLVEYIGLPAAVEVAAYRIATDGETPASTGGKAPGTKLARSLARNTIARDLLGCAPAPGWVDQHRPMPPDRCQTRWLPGTGVTTTTTDN